MVGTIYQQSFSKGEVTPELGGRGDLGTYKSMLGTARNVIVTPYGSLVNRSGTRFIGFTIGTGQKSRLRRFRFNTTDTYVLEFCTNTMRVIRNDAYVLQGFQAVNGVTASSNGTMNIPAHGLGGGDAIQCDSSFVGMPRLNGRWLLVHQVIDANNFVLGDPVTGGPLNTSLYGTYISGGNVARVYMIATPYAQADLPLLKFVQSADVLTITHPLYPEQALTRTGDAAWTLTQPTFAPQAAQPSGVSVTPAAGASTAFTYGVTSIDATTGEESFPASGTTTTSNSTRANTISWSAAANSTLYSVYLVQNGVYGLIGTTPNTTFNDNNYAPDLSVTPPSARNPFPGAGTYPGTSVYFQQRQIRAGSNNAPDTVFTSQVGNFYNMGVSVPSTDSDAITFTLTSNLVNQIRHFVPIKQDLLAFTAGNEWRITANGQAFAAENLAILTQSAWGCNDLEPLLLGLTVLFVRENGLTVRSARYTYVQDAYQGEDVSLLSNHLFGVGTQITAWATGITPYPLVVCVLGSGGIACLTYQEEQQISAWTRWDTQNGLFEDCDIIRPDLAANGFDDVPYFIVNRTIQGCIVRTVERLNTRRFTDVRDAFFVDGGLTYDNPVTITNVQLGAPITITAPNHNFNNNTTVDIYDVIWLQTFDSTGNVIVPAQLNGDRFAITVLDANTFQLNGSNGTGYVPYASNGSARAVATVFSGLDHLEGQTVSALCDGNATLGLTVVNGGFTLPTPSSRVHVGKQIIADVGTLDLEPPQGSLLGKVKRVPSVTLRLINTRGLLVGETSADLVPMKDRSDENLGDPTALFTGDEIVTTGNDWNKDGQLFIRQMNPLPMEILDIIPNMEAED